MTALKPYSCFDMLVCSMSLLMYNTFRGVIFFACKMKDLEEKPQRLFAAQVREVKRELNLESCLGTDPGSYQSAALRASRFSWRMGITVTVTLRSEANDL